MIKTLILLLLFPIAVLSQNIDTLKIVSTNKMLKGNNTVSIIESFDSSTDSSILITVHQDTIAKNFKCYYQFASPDRNTFWSNDSIRIKFEFEQYLIKGYEVSSKNQLLATLKNSSSTAIRLDTYDGEVSMIQEAVNKKGEWQPIEFYAYGDCGFGHHIISIQKGEQVRILTTRYSGDFKTRIRLKLLTKNGVFYSEEFDGHINASQFKKPRFKAKYKEYYSFLNE
jgi:hypothetical protein